MGMDHEDPINPLVTGASDKEEGSLYFRLFSHWTSQRIKLESTRNNYNKLEHSGRQIHQN